MPPLSRYPASDPSRQEDIAPGRSREPGLVGIGPGEGGTVGIGGVGGRQTDHSRGGDAAQPIDGAGKCELGSAQPLDEVAPPDPPHLLHSTEDRVQARESTREAFGQDVGPGQEAVAVEEKFGPGAWRRWWDLDRRPPASTSGPRHGGESCNRRRSEPPVCRPPRELT